MYKVRIDQFEGPFDLLLYLLESARMNIYDIRVAEITEQYIDYLREMDELNVEIGSEFIVLAATLIRLKSRMLLPRTNEPGEPEVMDDPRTELVSRLSEYRRAKRLAEMLQEREEYYSRAFTKPAEDISEYLESPEELLRTDTDQFVRAFLAFLSRQKRIAEVHQRYERMERQRSSVEDRIADMTLQLDRKWKTSDVVSFSELIQEDNDRYDVALSFLSLLEMVRLQEVEAVQQENYGDIRITRRGKGVEN